MVWFSLFERHFNYGVNGWCRSIRKTHSETRSNRKLETPGPAYFQAASGNWFRGFFHQETSVYSKVTTPANSRDYRALKICFM